MRAEEIIGLALLRDRLLQEWNLGGGHQHSCRLFYYVQLFLYASLGR